MVSGEQDRCDDDNCPVLMKEIARDNGMRILGMSPDRIEDYEDEFDAEDISDFSESYRFAGSQCQTIADVWSLYCDREGITCPPGRNFEEWVSEVLIAVMGEWTDWQRSLRNGRQD
jgi:hypothetical protein